jgi:glyoxylase-like metal-dependent hydrolase (beta-lactamase superfamily II)
MNLLEKELNYPLGDTLPEPGRRLQVAPGVYWLRMALPFALNHINLWLLRDRFNGVEGWCIVDCCLDSPESRMHWEQVFGHALDDLPVVRVLATHMHPDHLGLAHWLCERWQVPLFISATDYHTARTLVATPDERHSVQAMAFFRAHGLLDEHVFEALGDRSLQFVHMVPALPKQFVRLIDGQVLRIGHNDWHCISGYGHAPEHIALHCPGLNVLISGDMVLPRISSNISVYDSEPLADPLRLFLTSLGKYAHLPEDCLTLPSHGKPFTGVHKRIAQLLEHHDKRLDELSSALADKPLSALDAMSVLFTRQLDAHQITFAIGEALAHLHYLWYGQQAERYLDEDQVYRFKPTAAKIRP